MKKIDRTGEHKDNVDGLEMRIVEYNNNKDVLVYFPELDILRKTSYKQFKSGKVYPIWRNKVEITEDEKETEIDTLELGDNKAIAIALVVAMGTIVSVAIAGFIYSVTLLF